MTFFWLTRDSLCPLWPSCLIWYPWSLSFCLAFVAVPPCGSPSTFFIALSASFRAAPSPFSMGLSQSHYRLLFSHCTLFSSCFLLLFPGWMFSPPCPVCFCSILWVELTVCCIQDDSLSPEAKKITGNSLIWTCHSSCSAHHCWQLHHSPSALKLRVSFDIPLHVPTHLDNHGRLAARPTGIRGIFLVRSQKFRQSSK